MGQEKMPVKNCILAQVLVPLKLGVGGWAQWLMPVIPALLGGRGGWITSGQEFETSLANIVKPHLY